jgi:hypothetical protein
LVATRSTFCTTLPPTVGHAYTCGNAIATVRCSGR